VGKILIIDMNKLVGPLMRSRFLHSIGRKLINSEFLEAHVYTSSELDTGYSVCLPKHLFTKSGFRKRFIQGNWSKKEALSILDKWFIDNGYTIIDDELEWEKLKLLV
jgi:hypothetical protein